MSSPSFRTGSDGDVRRATRKQRTYIYDLIDECGLDDYDIDPWLVEHDESAATAAEAGHDVERWVDGLSVDEASEVIGHLQHYSHQRL